MCVAQVYDNCYSDLDLFLLVACVLSCPDYCLCREEAIVVWILDWAWNSVLRWSGNGSAHVPPLLGEWSPMRHKLLLSKVLVALG